MGPSIPILKERAGEKGISPALKEGMMRLFGRFCLS